MEAMSEKTQKKKGILIASRQLIEGSEREVQGILNYHQQLMEKVIVAEPGKAIKLDSLSIIPTPTIHAEETGIGFRFEFAHPGMQLGKLVISYTGDTSTFPEMIDALKGSDVLIINLIFPDEREIEGFMSIAGARKLLGAVKPKLAVITHFGMSMLRAGPERIAKMLSDDTGVRTIAAKDGLRLDLEKEIGIKGLQKFI
jgi:ribonuclease BN (tRNA processing enzyme)